MSKITNDDLTQSGTECFIASCTNMATVGVKGLMRIYAHAGTERQPSGGHTTRRATGSLVHDSLRARDRSAAASEITMDSCTVRSPVDDRPLARSEARADHLRSQTEHRRDGGNLSLRKPDKGRSTFVIGGCTGD